MFYKTKKNFFCFHRRGQMKLSGNILHRYTIILIISIAQKLIRVFYILCLWAIFILNEKITASARCELQIRLVEVKEKKKLCFSYQTWKLNVDFYIHTVAATSCNMYYTPCVLWVNAYFFYVSVYFVYLTIIFPVAEERLENIMHK